MQPGSSRLYAGAATLALIVVGLYLGLPLLSRTRAVRDRVELLAAELGFETQIGDLQIGYDFGVHLENVRFGDADEPFATVEAARVGLSLGGLLRGQPLSVDLAAPRLWLARLPAGGTGGGTVSIPFYRVGIEGGYVVAAEETFGPLTVSIDAIHEGQRAHLSLVVDPRLPPLDVAGSAHLDAGEIVVDQLQLQWSAVPLALLVERFPTAFPPTVAGTLDVSASASGALTALTGSGSLRLANLSLTAAGLKGTAPSSVVSGKFDGSATGIDFKGTVAATGIRAHDDTLEHAVENLAVGGPLEGHWKPSEPLQLRLELTAGSGELLWRRLYADLAQYPLQARGNVRVSTNVIDISAVEASIKGLGAVAAELRLHPYDTIERIEGSIEIPDLDPLYALAVRDPLRESYAFLDDTSVQGRLIVHGEYRRKKAGAGIVGELRLADTMLSSATPSIEIRGLHIDLPLRLGTLPAAAPTSGRVQVDGVTLGDLELPATSAALTVEANRIALAAPVAVPLLGGWLRLHALDAIALHQPQRQVSLGVGVENVGLTALTEALEWPPLNGTITGAIPKVTVDAQRVRSEGEIRIRVFDGDVGITDLRVDQLFSSIPTLGLDVDFDGISLGRLTEKLEVGSISGVIRGAVHDLTLVNGEPSSFDAWFETVPQPGVAQRVSVAAIRQLSVLGGSGGDPFSQGILGFFDEYRYAKMGFRCRLENDKFTLRGVEQIDGKDYLIVGSRLPPRVDVVSHNQVVSFSEMVRRLQRIGASAPPAEKGEQQ